MPRLYPVCNDFVSLGTSHTMDSVIIALRDVDRLRIANVVQFLAGDGHRFMQGYRQGCTFYDLMPGDHGALFFPAGSAGRDAGRYGNVVHAECQKVDRNGLEKCAMTLTTGMVEAL